ncbi:cold-inducible protein YdjO-related protein [Paenibacillus koleovorans]|uniref:cold-inducible protein YdjO-related protein n=1 Tax=Paenibacillus koleovorans TaxID=121608 RepID=UPI000FDC8AC7|nr:cold-inducible protein YdjO-related protein [Paenibacillus koleovorans]
MHTDTAKPELSPVPVWRCRDQSCKAWTREELASSASPECPICKGSMIRGIKYLPKLVKKHKAAPKKTDEADAWLR